LNEGIPSSFTQRDIPRAISVEAVVGNGLLRLALASGQGVEGVLTPLRMDEVDDRGGATGETGCGPGLEVVAGDGAGDRQLHVDMGIDPAGKDILVRGIHDLVTRRGLQVGTEGHDLPLPAEDVSLPALGIGDRRGVLDQYSHGSAVRVAARRAVDEGDLPRRHFLRRAETPG
jgi:hypothetical protein